MEVLDELLLEPSYRESVRRYNARLQEQHRWEWVRFFDRMARLHRQLSENYTARADALMCEDGAEQ